MEIPLLIIPTRVCWAMVVVRHRLETQMLFLLELPLLVLVRLIFDPVITHFNNYSNATTYKTILSRGNNASSSVTAYSALWRSTSAINEIKVFTLSGNLRAGSTFTLYGIAAA
jgi:hypothetical protein